MQYVAHGLLADKAGMTPMIIGMYPTFEEAIDACEAYARGLFEKGERADHGMAWGGTETKDWRYVYDYADDRCVAVFRVSEWLA